MEAKGHEFTPPEVEEIDEYLPAYEVQAFIAKGGMGAVYMARQKSLDRLGAIKILPSHFFTDAYLRSRFEAEAKNMAKLNHPNIISVHDYGQYRDQPYIVMEMVRGKSLYHSARGKKIDPRQAGRIVRDICKGLAHAHERGILHRDLKPANILLDPNRNPKIGDFGLARHVNDLAADKSYGSPGYMAPEVANDPKSVSESTDLYSVGVILYELLTAKRPEEPYVPVTELAKCDPDFENVIRKAIDPSPLERFVSASEMAKAIDQIINKGPPLPVAKFANVEPGPELPVAKILPEIKVATLPMAEATSGAASKEHVQTDAGTLKGAQRSGLISQFMTKGFAEKFKIGPRAPFTGKIVTAALILVGFLAWKNDWGKALGRMLYYGGSSLSGYTYQSSDTQQDLTKVVIPEGVKVHMHEPVLIGVEGDPGIVSLEGEKILDWVVYTGANISSGRAENPGRQFRISASTTAKFSEAARKMPVWFETGGKELEPKAATGAKTGNAKAGDGWSIGFRVPKQNNGPVLVTLCVFQQWAAFDIAVSLPNREVVGFQVPKQDPGVLRIPIEIPKPKKGGFYTVKITCAKDSMGDFAMGLNAVVVEKR